MKTHRLFIALAFIYTALVIAWGLQLPIDEAMSYQAFFGVRGLMPLFFVPVALPAFVLLGIALSFDAEGR